MSLSSVSGSSQLASIQSNYQRLSSQFKQLGQDLTAGDLTKAQTDFVTLSQAAASQFGSSSPIGQMLNSISQALQSGNLSAAQQAFASLPSAVVGPSAVPHHSHARHSGGGFSQALEQLGQALQSGNLSAAQQAFAAVQQSWSQLSGSSSTAMQPQSTSVGLSVIA